ncbi:MAG: AI-2E family transporter [Patescibacteria group bacterium]|nr:AI-2E family transporter [Patescibacteria group bacterium]
MLEDLKKEFTSFKLLSILLTIAVGIYLLQFAWGFLGNFSDVIIVLVLSWLLSFVLDPAVDKVSALFKISRTMAAIIIYALLTAIIALTLLLLIPAVSYQFDALSKIVPKYLDNSPKFVQKWDRDLISTLDNAASLIPSVANFLFLLLIVLIISFYLIVDNDKIEKEIYDLIPEKWKKNVKAIEGIINATFASFLRVQITFALINGILTWAVLSILGIDFAASTAVASGILTIIPMIGPILAILPPIFISFIIDPARAIAVFIILLIAQQIIFNIWGPKFMGKVFKVHPIVVLLSFIIGFKVAGIMGAIFAIPVISIVILIIRDLGHHFISSKAEK